MIAWPTTYVWLLALLVFVDCMMSSIRAAAGRNGLLDKTTYYRHVLKRAAGWALVLLLAHAIVALTLCFSSTDPQATWGAFEAVAPALVLIYGTFAFLIFAAFAFYFAPFGDFRVLTNVTIFGPLTLARPWVIAGGLAYAAYSSREPRVVVMAIVAGVAMLSFEPLLGRRYRSQWKTLLL